MVGPRTAALTSITIDLSDMLSAVIETCDREQMDPT
jgi:hypothetical protein